MDKKGLEMVQIKKQKKAAFAVAAAYALGAFAPTQAAAAPVNVVAGDYIKLYDGPGTTGGGEFFADVVGKGVGGTITGSNNDFIAFCLEFNETFAFGQKLKVGAVNTGAVNGGVSGQTSPNFDPISSATAWLYTQAMTSPGVLGYTHTQVGANALQYAIWFLEGELGASYTLTQLGNLNLQAKNWVVQAQTTGWTSGIGNVRALNMLRADSAGNYTINAQDQLYLAPIPEPETYAMLLAGLGLMGFVARRRKSRGLPV
jgi:hypothetical protein